MKHYHFGAKENTAFVFLKRFVPGFGSEFPTRKEKNPLSEKQELLYDLEFLEVEWTSFLKGSDSIPFFLWDEFLNKNKRRATSLGIRTPEDFQVVKKQIQEEITSLEVANVINS